jgi:hypothetical protein
MRNGDYTPSRMEAQADAGYFLISFDSKFGKYFLCSWNDM